MIKHIIKAYSNMKAKKAISSLPSSLELPDSNCMSTKEILQWVNQTAISTEKLYIAMDPDELIHGEHHSEQLHLTFLRRLKKKLEVSKEVVSERELVRWLDNYSLSIHFWENACIAKKLISKLRENITEGEFIDPELHPDFVHVDYAEDF